MSENWLPVVGYEGLYEVSDHGRVRSLDRVTRSRPGRTRLIKGTPLKPMLRSGYPTVGLSSDGTARHCPVHRLVCKAFHGASPTPTHEVRHLNGNPHDNRAVNLAWGTRSENALDTISHGTNREAKKTHCLRGHPFDEANTYQNKRGHRFCRRCHRESQRSLRQKKRVAA